MSDKKGDVDPVARLAIIAVPFLIMLLGAVTGIWVSGLTNQINDLDSTVTTMQQGFAVQAQILQTIITNQGDHETRLRALERWQDFVNGGAGPSG